jgi:hypothetical protein
MSSTCSNEAVSLALSPVAAIATEHVANGLQLPGHILYCRHPLGNDARRSFVRQRRAGNEGEEDGNGPEQSNLPNFPLERYPIRWNQVGATSV